jgi:V/A-type H+/Na+-transporting ATPase subunit F
MRYFVIGDEDTVLGFGLVGVEGVTAADEEQAQRAFDRALGDGEIAVVIITERCADLMRTTVDRYLFAEDFPLILEIPDRAGRIPGRPTLREVANNAIGISV